MPTVSPIFCILASLQAPRGKTSPKTGFDLYAVLLKKLLRKSNLFNAKMPTYGKNDGLRSDNLINNINAEVF